MQRLTRVLTSFLITFACYATYATAIAPLLEPRIQIVSRPDVTQEERDAAKNAADRQREELGIWFGEGDWELNAPKILETQQGKLLFEDYQPLEDGRIEIHPCSMVFLSADKPGDADDGDRRQRAIVLRAPQGAVLKFDTFDLKHAAVGKLIGGELHGEVYLHCAQRLPGPEDDLEVTTRDVLLNENEIATPHSLEFRLGPHFGRGQGVRIHLDKVDVASKNPQIRGAKSITLYEKVFMHLAPSEGASLFPGRERQAKSQPAQTAVAADRRPSPPVEVRCSGTFTFDFVENAAIFRKSVEVLRLHPNGLNDQMNGEQLRIDFTADAASPSQEKFGMKKMEPTRIEMTGEPLVIRTSEGLHARGQFLEHEIATRSVRLRDAVETIVRHEAREIHAPEVYYLPGPDGRAGTFLAEGRGRIQGSSPDDATQTFEAEWTERMHFRPHEERQVLSAYGSARYEARGRGALAADEIHFWLHEVPKANADSSRSSPSSSMTAGGASGPLGGNAKFELIPDRMLALGRVQIDSPQLTAAVTRVEGWFEQEAGQAVVHRVRYGGEVPFDGGVVQAAGETSMPLLFPPSQAKIGPTPSQPAELPEPSPTPTSTNDFVAPRMLPPTTEGATPLPPEQQFHIDGEVLRLQIALLGRTMQVREAIVERNVRLVETKSKKPTDKPLTIVGDRLHLVQPNAEQSHVVVNGVPAQIQSEGATISGGKLVLDRPDKRTNHAAVEGQGVLTLPVDRDLQGRPTASDTLHLSWQGGMTFDGTTAVFRQGVEGLMSTQYLRTDRLHVVFSKAPDFGATSASANGTASLGSAPFGSAGDGKTEISRVDCFDGVFIESRTANPDGSPAAVDRIESRTLSLDQKSGDVYGEGPGEVTSVRMGNAVDPTATNPAALAGRPPTINYLNVRFQRSFSGNRLRRDLTFQNQVRALHGPVPDWTTKIDPDRPEKWAQQTVMIDSDRMQVFTRPPSAGGVGDSYDLVAEGNTLVEGTNFTTRSPRLTYAQAKDLLVIEGDNRTDAVLYQQQRAGIDGSGTTAKRFMIWPSTRRVQVDGVTTIDLRAN